MVKSFPCKKEDLSFTPNIHKKVLGMLTFIVPELRKWKWVATLGSLARMHCRFSERPFIIKGEVEFI